MINCSLKYLFFMFIMNNHSLPFGKSSISTAVVSASKRIGDYFTSLCIQFLFHTSGVTAAYSLLLLNGTEPRINLIDSLSLTILFLHQGHFHFQMALLVPVLKSSLL